MLSIRSWESRCLTARKCSSDGATDGKMDRATDSSIALGHPVVEAEQIGIPIKLQRECFRMKLRVKHPELCYAIPTNLM